MTKTNKSLLTVILAILCSVLIAMGVGFSQPVAYAEDGTALENATFVMDGPEVRVDGNNGMRFMAKMSKTDYEKVVGAYDSVEFGVIIMPEYYLGLAGVGAIDYESVFGTNAKFAWDMDTAFDGAKYNVIHMDSNASEYDETTMSVKGSVVEMKPENLATAYVANVYAKATKGDVVEYKFATMAEENSSMLEVAFKAINSGLFDNTNAYDTLNGYKTQYEEYKGGEATYSYTVNYVANGQTIKSDKVEGIAMNTAVEAEIALPDGYVLDTSKESVTKGHIYASDIELTVYVKEIQYKALTGALNGGELYFFEKQTAETTYDIVLPVALGNVNPIVKIADVALTATYEDATKTLSLLPEEFASFGNGQTTITIITSDTVYTAVVTIADYVITTETEYKTVFPAGGTARFTNYVVLGNDITFTSSYAGYAGNYVGIFDGKGYAIKNLSMPESAIGLFYEMHGQILNLALINVKANGHGGVIANVMGGLIDNVFIQGVAAGHGSLGNSVSNTLSNSIVIVEKNSFDLTTGAIANNMKGTATNCFAVSKSFVNAFNNPTGTVNNCDIKTSAEDLVALFNGKLPAGFNTYWSFDNGSLKFGDEIIVKKTSKLTNAQNAGGQLFYFGKDTTDCADYASKFISGENYVIQTAIDLGMVESVKIGTTAITGFAYANKQLTIPVAQIASLANGDAVMEIVTATADYSADVTVADCVITSENEYRKVMGENGVYTLKSSGYVVLGNDITFTSAYAGHGDGSGSVDKVFAGTLDGKGYAIKNIIISGPALIEQLGGSGVIKNLAIINATHTASNVGLLLNQNFGKVENVFVSGLMASRSVINACYASGKISNVIVDVEKVASVTFTGAVVRNLQGTATNCYATSDTFTTIYHTATGTATNCEFKATNAELLAYFNGTLPTGFNSYWTISNGSLSFGNNVVMSAN